MIGRLISGYSVTEALGRSGNGEVFKAEDLRLRRTVVLKILSKRWKDRANARARFVEEAQAASGLDHPNICRIYEIGETEDGLPFTVSPFYGGQSVREWLSERDSIPWQEIVDVVRQTANGLQQAHDAGIVHRDIRPENLLVTYEGHVKILDFGLEATRPFEPDGSSRGDQIALYRAPEQTSEQGSEGAKPATDQWSLALVAFELLTGRPAFPKGDGPMPTNLDEAWDRGAAPDLSFEARQTLRRATARAPEDRFSSVVDFARALAKGRASEPGLPNLRETAIASQRPSTPWWSSAWALGLVALSALVLAYLFTPSAPGTLEPVLDRTRLITHQPGLEKHPSFSPDGTKIAYAGDHNGNMDIWLFDIHTEESYPLTADFSGYDDHPTFTPDGSRIAFVSARSGGGLYWVPAQGGAAELLIPHALSASHDSKVRAPTLAFTPDSKTLFFSGVRSAPGLFALDLDSKKSRRLEVEGLGDPFSLSQPAVSPDGQRIALTEISGTGTSIARLWTVDLDGNRPIPITEGLGFDQHPRWDAEGRRIFFISDRQGNRDLWHVELGDDGSPSGEAQALTVGIDVGTFALSHDRRRLVYSKINERSNIWSLPIQADPVDPQTGRPLTSENQLIEFVDISPDGLWMAFDSNRAGNVDIWLFRLLDGELRQLTRDTAHDWRPRFSPDGKWVVFYSLRSGNRDLWLQPVSGEPARRLTRSESTEWMPSWSPDGSRIAYDSSDNGRRSIWWLAVDDEPAPERLSPEWPEDCMYPIFSPDGASLVFSLDHDGSSMGLYRQTLPHGDPEPITQGWANLFALRWTEDGLIYAHGHRHASDPEEYWQIDSTTGETRRLTRLESARKELMEGFTVHDRTLYFPLWEMTGDLWLAELSPED